MKPTIRIDPTDEPGFLRAQRAILEPYEAALRQSEDEPDLFVAIDIDAGGAESSEQALDDGMHAGGAA